MPALDPGADRQQDLREGESPPAAEVNRGPPLTGAMHAPTATATTAATTPSATDDFPEWIPAVVVKELRQGMRAKLFIVPFVAVHVVATVAVLVEAALVTQLAVVTGPGAGGAGPSLAFARGLLLMVAWAVLVLVVPLRGLTALREEIAGSNFELLAAARVTRWRIVIGKWLVLCAQSWLLAVSLAPYFLVRYFAGGLDVTGNLVAAASLLGMNAASSALAVGASGFKSYAARSALWIGGVAALSAAQAAPSAPFTMLVFNARSSSAPDWIAWVSVAATAAVAAVYTLYGLQLGRAKIRPSLRPYELNTATLIIALIFVTPFIELIGFLCFFVPGLLLPLVLAAVVLRLDARPGPARPT